MSLVGSLTGFAGRLGGVWQGCARKHFKTINKFGSAAGQASREEKDGPLANTARFPPRYYGVWGSSHRHSPAPAAVVDAPRVIGSLISPWEADQDRKMAIRSLRGSG